MTIEQELRLSYYREVADIDPEHGVCLVQDVRTRKFYVKKRLTVYHAGIYQSLLTRPVEHTPRIFLAEEDENVLTVIEEFIPGDTLEELLERSGTLAQEQVIDIAIQLCGILSAFHSRVPAVINRDIKPSNLKLTSDGVLKLLDLNAAKWSGGEAERDTVLLGTQGYAAPEQYGFGPSSILTDIYSVGVLMHVMLTGRFPGREVLPGKLGRIVKKCVELSPAARYQSTEELRGALEELQEGKELPAAPDRKKDRIPGFRGGIVTSLFSAMGYGMLFYIVLGMEFEGAGLFMVWVNRIAIGAALVGMVFFNGNYRGWKDSFSLTRSPRRSVRWLGMALVDFAMLFLAGMVTVFIENLFFK